MGRRMLVGIFATGLVVLVAVLAIQFNEEYVTTLPGRNSLEGDDGDSDAVPLAVDVGERSGVSDQGSDEGAWDEGVLRVNVSVREHSSRMPLAGARVLMASADGEFLGEAETNSLGEAEALLQMPGAASIQVGVSLGGFLSARGVVRRAKAGDSLSLSYELSSAEALSGYVVGGLSGRPVSGATVVLVPVHQRFSKQVLLLAAEGVSETLIAVADDHGRFEVSGVARGRPYRVYAGGEGQVSRAPTFIYLPENLSPDTQEALRLEIYPAFGLALHLEDLSGVPVQFPSTSDIGLVMTAPEAWAGSLSGVPFWTLGLAVEDLLAGVEERPGNAVQWAYVSSREGSSVAGVSIAWDHPGCSFEAAVDVPRVDGSIPRRSVAFDCIGSTSVSVSLRFSGTSQLAGIAYDSPVYYLSMQEAGNPMGSVLRFQMLPDRDGYKASGVPPGRYEYSIKPLSNWWRFPRIVGGLLVIEEGRDCEIEVPVSGVSAIDLSVIDDGVPYEGQLRVGIRLVALDDAGPDATPERFGSVKVDFAHAPYIIPVLGPGDYKLSLLGGELGREVVSESLVRVEGGIAATLMDRWGKAE